MAYSVHQQIAQADYTFCDVVGCKRLVSWRGTYCERHQRVELLSNYSEIRLYGPEAVRHARNGGDGTLILGDPEEDGGGLLRDAKEYDTSVVWYVDTTDPRVSPPNRHEHPNRVRLSGLRAVKYSMMDGALGQLMIYPWKSFSRDPGCPLDPGVPNKNLYYLDMDVHVVECVLGISACARCATRHGVFTKAVQGVGTSMALCAGCHQDDLDALLWAEYFPEETTPIP